MTIVDTNYLVRLFTRTPVKQAEQVLLDLQASEPHDILLQDYVLSELVYVLQFHSQLAYSRQQIAEGLQLILSHPAWRCDQELHQQALEMFATTKFDYVDCLVASEYKLGRIEKVFTFDKKLRGYLT